MKLIKLAALTALSLLASTSCFAELSQPYILVVNQQFISSGFQGISLNYMSCSQKNASDCVTAQVSQPFNPGTISKLYYGWYGQGTPFLYINVTGINDLLKGQVDGTGYFSNCILEPFQILYVQQASDGTTNFTCDIEKNLL